MPEIQKEIKQYQVNYVCDSCTKGLMIKVPDKKYLHKCNNCGHLETFVGVEYPHYKQELV